MVGHPMVALLLLPLNQSLALQPLGLRLEKARQLTLRPQVILSTEKQKVHPPTADVNLENVISKTIVPQASYNTDSKRTYIIRRISEDHVMSISCGFSEWAVAVLIFAQLHTPTGQGSSFKAASMHLML